jgi:hypothetical protein
MKLTRVTLATASSVLLVATLAACGGDSDDDTATDDRGAVTTQGGPGGGPGGGNFPGAFGEVAAVSGKTAQVQNDQSGQVAVSWTADTRFSQQVDAALDDVEVGSCVMVTSDDGAGSTEITATSVRIMDECDTPSGMPSDLPSDLSSDMPSDVPSDMPSGRPVGFGTVGEVTAVSGDGFTVSTGDDEVSVMVSGDTTYTTTAKATADAVKVGICVNAQGDTDDTGALTATSISVSQKVDGRCTGGFGTFAGGPGGAA